jgi:hypothetical protein
MRIFTRTTKVLGLAQEELGALADMLDEAKSTLKAERQIGSNEFLAIEVSPMYAPHKAMRTKDSKGS